MAKITLHGNPFNTCGELPETGKPAPSFQATDKDLGTFEYKGEGRIVLNIFPSIDTPVCAAAVRHFNEKAVALKEGEIAEQRIQNTGTWGQLPPGSVLAKGDALFPRLQDE